MKPQLNIVQLYPKDMNIYGDWGNVLTVMRRAQWHGYEPVLHEYNPGDTFIPDADIIIGGGGQDAGQDKIQADLLKLSSTLHDLVQDGCPMLVICGLYQLFGTFFRTKDGHQLQGVGIFDHETHGGPERMIGNIIIESDEFGQVVGYENHSGQTFLSNGVQPLGKVIKGAGNNGQDDYEGARIRNVIGSYLHGSLLPKNPLIADWLVEKAAMRRYGEYKPTVIDDRFANEARKIALTRPR
jgi:lipid II isoglutaminyl synthase (glutamine-hydrolysing)